MMPGVTTLPRASTTATPSGSGRSTPTAAMMPSTMSTSAVSKVAPVPVMTRAPRTRTEASGRMGTTGPVGSRFVGADAGTLVSSGPGDAAHPPGGAGSRAALKYDGSRRLAMHGNVRRRPGA